MSKSLREQLIGAWKLVSYEIRPVDGSPAFYPLGERPMGIILYTPDGYMSAQLSALDRRAAHLYQSGFDLLSHQTRQGVPHPNGKERR